MTSTDRPPVTAPTARAEPKSTRVPGTGAAGLALAALAGIAAWLSYASVRTAALPVFGPRGGSAFPLLLDTGVFAASEYYLRSVRANRPMAGFRTLTRALIAATVAVNVSAADSARGALLHAVPPALFAALVELRARQILGDVRHQAGAWPDRIPIRLWLTSPFESFRLWLWVAKAGSHSTQRAAREQHLVAVRALKLALPGRIGDARTARALVRRQLRAGTLAPAILVTATGLDADIEGTGAAAVLRVALRAALTASATQPADTPTPPQDPATAAEVPLPEPPRRPIPATSKGRTPAPRKNVPDTRTWEQLLDKAREVNAQAIATMGAPAGVGRLKREVGVGQDRAQQLRDYLAATQVALPRIDQVAPPTRLNGHEIETSR
jgi:hypothetical protein